MAKPDSVGFHLRGIAGIVAGVPVLAAVLLTRRWLPSPGWPALAVDVAGWLLLIAGIYLRLASIVFVGGRKGKSLVTDGPYSSCRNPLYLASLTIATSAALLLHSLTMFAAIALAGFFYVAFVIPAEERQLSAAFPEEWKAYVAAVPRLIPRRRWKAGQQWHEIDLRALRNESLRVAGMAAIPMFIHILEFLRDQSWWPRWNLMLP
jgi:protein-S-isoprenylcysteine O-methyltransferase Ste14